MCRMGTRGTFGTPRRRAAFVAAIAKGLSVEEAARAINAGRRTLYRWREVDAEFRAAWDDAYDARADAIEAKMQQLALAGDPTVGLFMLRARKPEIYNPLLVLRMEMLKLAKAKAAAEAIGIEHQHRDIGEGGVFITIPDNTRGFPAIEGEAAAAEGSEDAA